MNPQAATPAPVPTASPVPAQAAAMANQAPFQGAGLPATPAVPTYDPGQAVANIAKYFQIPSQTAGVVGQQTANAYNAQTQYENSIRNTQYKAQQLKDAMDPSQYHISQNSDGSTKIIDPMGQEVDNGTFVNRTGTNPTYAFKNSQHPEEQQFVQDYNNYQTYLQNAVQAKFKDGQPQNEAAKVVDAFNQAHPELTQMTAKQVQQLFMSQYGKYFGMPQSGQTPTQQSFTPIINSSGAQYSYERDYLNGQGNAGITGTGIDPQVLQSILSQSAANSGQ